MILNSKLWHLYWYLNFPHIITFHFRCNFRLCNRSSMDELYFILKLCYRSIAFANLLWNESISGNVIAIPPIKSFMQNFDGHQDCWISMKSNFIPTSSTVLPHLIWSKTIRLASKVDWHHEPYCMCIWKWNAQNWNTFSTNSVLLAF